MSAVSIGRAVVLCAVEGFNAFVIHRIVVGVLLFGLLGAGVPHG
ncbi:hypothetical protein GCM10022384_37140 [Streptomyces marokkonensis]|uniref:Uncharacterized protein n=1 Tax=Streptomyces marokkonensis TaxID=324855 RepID=A0ABP7QN50_9ACTN